MVVIVVISAEFNNSKEICSSIKNKTFDSVTNVNDYLRNVLTTDEIVDDYIFVYELDEFTQAINNEEISMDNSFITYVNI